MRSYLLYSHAFQLQTPTCAKKVLLSKASWHSCLSEMSKSRPKVFASTGTDQDNGNSLSIGILWDLVLILDHPWQIPLTFIAHHSAGNISDFTARVRPFTRATCDSLSVCRSENSVISFISGTCVIVAFWLSKGQSKVNSAKARWSQVQIKVEPPGFYVLPHSKSMYVKVKVCVCVGVCR